MQALLSRTGALIVIFIATGLLAGCMAAKSETRFYVLSPIGEAAGRPGDVKARGPVSVEVMWVHLPQYLERPQIVTKSGENRLDLAEYRQWGGNLRKNMTRVLAKNLSILLHTPQIAMAPHHPPDPPDFRVEVEVMSFERGPDRRVRLSAQWRLSGRGDGRPPVTRICELSSPEIEDQGPDLDSTVAAMSGLLGELSRRIAQAIAED
jgi:uncharacterized lipoprotein YmbA